MPLLTHKITKSFYDAEFGMFTYCFIINGFFATFNLILKKWIGMHYLIIKS